MQNNLLYELTACRICPHRCGINRYIQTGKCKARDTIRVNIWQLHHGEEPVISGKNGSGTIFFPIVISPVFFVKITK